ncbi:unnamed protein product, partial [marine sediment metagenome]
TSAFEGIIKSTDEKYPGLLSAQDKDELEKIKDKYPEDSLDSIVEIIRKLIEEKDELKSDDLIMCANESIVKGLQNKDKYAYFFYPENYKIMIEDYSGHISGVGMYVNQIDEKIVVVKPIENTPAYRAGIKADDVIMSVDGQSIESKNIDEVIAVEKERDYYEHLVERQTALIIITEKKRSDLQEIYNQKFTLLTSAKKNTTQLEYLLRQQEAEAKMIEAYLASLREGSFSGKFLWPTVRGRISSGFGYRNYPRKAFHYGIDIAVPYGSPIFA